MEEEDAIMELSEADSVDDLIDVDLVAETPNNGNLLLPSDSSSDHKSLVKMEIQK